MSERFSAILRAGDLNDFIAPSQGCVVSLKGNKLPAPTPSPALARPRISAEERKKLGTAVLSQEPVKISLKDCLACSGCITSAETVLLEKQSLDEFLPNLNCGKTVIISISPQSRASIAVHYGISPVKAFKKLTSLFKSLGVQAVFDTSCSRDLTLIESCHEFMTRYKHRQSATDDKSKLPLPMIASACPGWICYAEKTLAEKSDVLPYISRVKSPQQAMGSIVKKHLCQKLGVRSEDIYHVTVMPCYDKKLEAVRDDFAFEVEPHGPVIPEVDTVLTTGEVLDLIKSKSIDFEGLDDSPLDHLLTNVDEGDDQLYGVHGSSGGYAETIFRYAAKELFGQQIAGPLDFKNKRKGNSDFRELTLEIEGKVVLKFALCYGFRNLVNVVHKIGKDEYHFLEIMACPSGCLNGGGQIKPKQGESGKDLIQKLESKYMENVLEAGPFENPIIKQLYTEWLDEPGSEKAKSVMHTAYHPRISTSLQW